MQKRTVILLVIDGWGLGPESPTNPLYTEPVPIFDYMRMYYPCGSLQASGISVGLPWGEEGNSEVGHMTIGAGSILYQHYPRITMAIKDDSFFANEVLISACQYANEHRSALHLAGMLSTSNVNASYDHLIALLQLAQKQGVTDVRLHLFTDGRDSGNQEGRGLVAKLQKKMEELGIGRIASISGRYYASDRDEHWDRTERAYRALNGKARANPDISAIFDTAYQKNNDEYLEPTCIDPELGLGNNDALIFYDYREDGIRQLAAPFVDPEFDAFEKIHPPELHVATLTRYKENYTAPVAFPPQTIEYPLGRVLSENGKLQLRIAETEKYAHVTYFFNGLKDKPYKNEYRVLVPSHNDPHPDQHPEMQTKEVTNRIIGALQERTYDFILANFAAADIIAHTGNAEAAKQTIQVINREVTRLVENAQATNSILIVTADHGNIERMLNPLTGIPETKHNSDTVPIYIVANEFATSRTLAEGKQLERIPVGILSDIAPTILAIMNMEPSDEMTGDNLLHNLLSHQ